MDDFVDITIKDLDVERTAPSSKAPGLRHMYLVLSNTPPGEWADAFDVARRFPRHSMWRRAWIEGKYIVIDCPPEELEKHHLSDLKEDVATANLRYREYKVEQDRQRASEKQTESAERQRLEDVRGRLKF